jgi:signal transduction histidine kinase
VADDRPEPGLRARFGTVRVRTSLAAVLVVGMAMALGALVLVGALRNLLADEVANAAVVRAAELAAMDTWRTVSAPIPVADPDDELVQIFDARGTVLAASANVAGRPPVARPGAEEHIEVDALPGEYPFVAVSLTEPSASGPLTVLVARTLEPAAESTELVGLLLAVGLPVLLLVIAATTWMLVGRALAPVERIRREVDEISAAQLHRRVPARGYDEIARLAQTMNHMLDRLEGGQERQRRFVADASHELRSPVATIRQHAEVALAHPAGSSTSELARTVLTEDLRIQRLIEDLLLLARADEHQLLSGREQVDLDDLVFAEARRLRSATDLRIATAAVSAGRVLGNEAALRRVLRNLGDNAARHAHSHIAFSVAEYEGVVHLGVEDDGVGIAPDDRERVLERFVRLDEARTRDSGGSGLGLAIVAELVRAHGGRVCLADSPQGGVRVEVTLPGADSS